MTHKIGEMFMLGFRTPEIPEWLHSFASEFGLGGVILFDYDVTIKKYERNIFDKAQVKKLCKEIYALPSRPLIYVDQEGGKVWRLRTNTVLLLFPAPSKWARCRRPTVWRR